MCTNLYKSLDVIFEKPHAEIQKTYFMEIKKKLQLKTTEQAACCSLQSCSQRTTESSTALICLLLPWFPVFHMLMDSWLLLSAKQALCFAHLKVLHSEIKESSMFSESFEKKTVQTVLISVVLFSNFSCGGANDEFYEVKKDSAKTAAANVFIWEKPAWATLLISLLFSAIMLAPPLLQGPSLLSPKYLSSSYRHLWNSLRSFFSLLNLI